MTELELVRFAYSELGTFGLLRVGDADLYTVERPWLGNQVRVSCIPEGTYRCRPRRYNRGGYDAIEVTNVPGRSHILFHKGNTMHDLAGCIAPTSRLGCLNGLWAGLGSRTAFNALMDMHGQTEFDLTIRGVRP